MSIEYVDNYLKNHGLIVVKFYSLEYTIEYKDSKYTIYAIITPKIRKRYNSLMDLLENYLVYGESIKKNINSLSLITNIYD